jgi:isochorismate pyruvate lyase
MDLTRIRKNIDDLDSMIITLLAKRADFVSAAGQLKKNEQGVRDPKRVERVIERVRARAIEKGLDPEIAERTYRTIIACFIDKELLELSKEKRSQRQETGGLR